MGQGIPRQVSQDTPERQSEKGRPEEGAREEEDREGKELSTQSPTLPFLASFSVGSILWCK